MSKYDWSNVPKEVMWLATDEGDDFAFGFSDEPHMNIEYGFWDGDAVNGITSLELSFKGDWRESLEARPCSDQ